MKGDIASLASLSRLGVLALLLTSCSASSSSHSSVPAITVISNCGFQTSSTPNQLPDLKLPCLNSHGYTKNKISLRSLKGPFVINLWGSWCPPCKEEMPLFHRLYVATERSKALSIVGVDVEEASAKDGLNFMIDQGMEWPQLADNNQVTRADFGMGIPVTWFVNAKGAIKYKKVGQIHSWDQMRALILLNLGINIPS